MSITGITLRRGIRRKQRRLMVEIAAEGDIEGAAREYMAALGVLRAELFIAIELDSQIKQAAKATAAMRHSGLAESVSSRAA